MKIVHLVDYFQPKLGYQETFLAKEHSGLGHSVWVVTSDRYYPFDDYEKVFYKILGRRIVGAGTRIEEGIRTLRLKSFEIPGAPLIYMFDLMKTFRKIKPDIIFCHNMFSLTSARIAYIKPKIGFELIYDSHTADFNSNLTDTLPKKIYHFLYHLMAVPQIKKQSDAVFTIGGEEQEFVCREFNLPKKSVPIIRLGIDAHIFRFSRKFRRLLRQKYNISDDKTVIIFTGKIYENKEIHILLEAVKETNSKRFIVILVGGGDREYIYNLKRVFEKLKIIWIPFVENKDLFKYYSVADIAVWPGNPSISVLEAMGCRLPVILPFCYTTKYLDKSGGILRFKRGDTKELAAKLVDWVKDKHSRLQAGEKANRFIQYKLTWRQIAQDTLKLVNL